MSATQTENRRTCTPCRGSGRVSSALGGQPHQVTCPWCGGSGQFQPGRDAQQAVPGGADPQGGSR